jgi:2-iminoacetate synthase
MPADAVPALHSFADWIMATDDHAPRRLELLEQAERILAGKETGDDRGRLALAVRLERWRYQLLQERGPVFTPRDRGLADALDLAANRLVGRNPRPPRSPRSAIFDSSRDADLDEALAGLDPRTPPDRLAARARELTQEHFGAGPARSGTATRPVLLYAPLYLSNHCANYCLYCGFRYPNDVARRHLSSDEALREAEILTSRGFRHILLVTGDFPRLTTTAYIAGILSALRARGIAPAVEIAPQSTDSYEALLRAGACGVTLYQETYAEELYARYHPRGTKIAFDWRLEGLERAAEAGMKRLGLGVLLGLADPREDLLALIRHGRYLQARFPDRRLAFSLPRIHDAPRGFRTPFPVDDTTFVRLYCALRIAFPQADLVLSTREPANLRGRLARICITQMSAGSCTSPGGYAPSDGTAAGQQFPVCDHRSPAEVAAWLESEGLRPVWEAL